MEKRLQEGSLEPLPVERIEEDALRTHVPVYEQPFLAQRLVRELRVGRCWPGRGGVSCDGEPWLWRDWEHRRDADGRLHVRRVQDAYAAFTPVGQPEAHDRAQGDGRVDKQGTQEGRAIAQLA